MKLTKLTVMTLATLAFSAMAYANPHNFDIFSSNTGNASGLNFGPGALLNYPIELSPFNNGGVGYPPLSTNTYVTAGESTGGAYNVATPDFGFLSPSAQTCDDAGAHPGTSTFPCSAALSYTTGDVTVSNFALVIQPFLDADSFTVAGVASLASGGASFFWTADDGSASDGLAPQDFDNFLEIDITLGAYDNGNSNGTGAGGVFRIGYGINGVLTGINLFQDSAGDYVLTGTSSGSRGETIIPQSFTLLDADFDPITVPEPTTLFLLGSGLIVVARRFRR